MLLALSIRDFVIVERMELEFEAGFTVLTGETGAGKSILIDALQFALGERADAGAVREGTMRAEVGAEFRAGSSVHDWLARSEFDGSDSGGDLVLVRRTLDPAGRSRGFVNGRPATLGQLRELGEMLLDVHGQHEHQLLLRPSAQQQLLDEHGGLRATCREVAGAFAAWRDATRERALAQAAGEQAAAQTEELRVLLEDLAGLAPEAGEWERVEAEQRRLAHASALIEGARAAIDAIADGEQALQPRLARIDARLSALGAYDERLGPVLASLSNAQIHVEEAARELNQYLGSCELDEGRLAQVEERIAALHAAGRKWRTAPAKLPELLETTRARLQLLQDSGDLAKLRARELAAAANYERCARELSAARRIAASRMGQEVTRAMQELAMSGGRFEVRLHASEPAHDGLERTEFLVCSHEGGSARALAKVASGGELSRIGLAIAVIAASANPVPSLIFDEVDAGIGGQVAATVGRLLRQLGKARQVFCVTHLPQVASCGDHHIAVQKLADAAGRPVSHTEVLSGNSRVQEIARMLGGAQITSLTQEHAREMLINR